MAKTKVNSSISARSVLFCDYALISNEGKVSILGVFDQVYSTSDKPFLNRAFVVGILEGKAEEKAEIEVEMIDQEGKNILPKRILSTMFGPSGVANILVDISNLSFDKAGKYSFQFSSGGKIIAQAGLEVIKNSGVLTKSQGN